MLVPFISQIATLPNVSCHKMSLMPSPLKSPVPLIDHGPGTLATNELFAFNTLVPFISQIATLPDVSRHRMSALPSPSKSPVPATDQFGGTTPSPTVVIAFAPLMSDIAGSLVRALRHRMSPLPSPSKSPVPTTTQPATFPSDPVEATPVPFMNQIAA